MNPQGADLLSQLRDIHAAPPAPWWPPAPGWWILAVLLALALAVLLRHAWLRMRRQLRRRRLLRIVDWVAESMDPARHPQEFLAALNRIFKTVAMAAFPEARCAGLQGRDWVRFLQERIGTPRHADQLDALADGPYQPRTRFDQAELTRLARLWVSRYG